MTLYAFALTMKYIRKRVLGVRRV